jgi:ERCC4-type nuclease
VPGVGPKRKRTLLRHFGSLSALRDASQDEIAEVSGISRDAAKNVYDFLHASREAIEPEIQEEENEEMIAEKSESAELPLEELAAEPELNLPDGSA